MRRSFSFTGDAALLMLHSLTSLLPGIEKVIGVFYSLEKEKMVSVSVGLHNAEYIFENLDIAESMLALQKIRHDNAPYAWLRKEDLPFEIISKEKVQLNIFNELNNSVLLIRIPNSFDKQNDLYLLYFNQGLSNFGTVEIKKILSTENKTIIGYLIRNTILMQLRTINEDKEVYLGLTENTQAILKDISNLKQELGRTRELYKDGLIGLCNNYLGSISQNTGKSYRLDENAILKLKEYKGDVSGLGLLMEKAARNAETFYPTEKFNEILIADYHIHFDQKVEKRQKETLPELPVEIPVKYSKTLVLLDKLENAAKQVKSRNKLLTSSNIGNEFPSPITPPAITDALKKHRSKILVLFREYPQRWETIRNEFRPVQNMLNPRTSLDKLSA